MLFIGFILLLVSLVIYSYGFVDLNLHLTDSRLFAGLQAPLSDLVYRNMPWAGAIFTVLVLGLYGVYGTLLQGTPALVRRFIPFRIPVFFVLLSTLLLFSFPAFTYDLFNYMTTASVTYTHRENPYVIKPVDIPNEPGLAYTRAANKVALYGPTWLLLTWVPHVLGAGNVWQTIVMFKLLIAVFYGIMLYVIYKATKNWKNVFFFGLNPLILIEVLVSGHNDIVMMVLALLSLGIGMPVFKNFWLRIAAWFASLGVKGATVVLLPFVLRPPGDPQKLFRIAYWLMFAVFVFVAPLREELYPWYAVWFLTFAAFMPIEKRSFIHGFSVALCLGLTFRHLPYIVTREYGGPGPMLRLLSTTVPPAMYILWYIKRFGFGKLLASLLYDKH